jgi:hypothetical protein
MVKEIMYPLNKLLASIVEKILGTHISEETVCLCCASVIGQWVYYCNARYISPLFQQDMSSPEEIERIADYITRLSFQDLEKYSEVDKARVKEEAYVEGIREDWRRQNEAGFFFVGWKNYRVCLLNYRFPFLYKNPPEYPAT